MHLNNQNIIDMISPITNDVADISISIIGNTPIQWRISGVDCISGQRFLSRDIIIPHIEEISHLKPFGFEVFLNNLIVKNKYRIKLPK